MEPRDRNAASLPVRQYFNLADGMSGIVASGLGRISPLITATPDGRTVLFARQDYSRQDLVLVENFR
jgi:hypothetical protein